MSKALDYVSIAWRGALTGALLAIMVAASVFTYEEVHVGKQLTASLVSITADVHGTTQKANTAIDTIQGQVKGTIQYLNANLIHLDIILGDTARVTEKEDAFWDKFSTDSLSTLTHVNTFLSALDTTTTDVGAAVKDTSQHTTRDMDALTKSSTPAIRQLQTTLNSVNTDAINFHDLLVSPYILGTMKNVDSTTAHVATGTDTIDKTLTDIQGGVHKTLHPSKKRMVLNYIEEAIGLGAHGAEVRYYLHPPSN